MTVISRRAGGKPSRCPTLVPYGHQHCPRQLEYLHRVPRGVVRRQRSGQVGPKMRDCQGSNRKGGRWVAYRAEAKMGQYSYRGTTAVQTHYRWSDRCRDQSRGGIRVACERHRQPELQLSAAPATTSFWRMHRLELLRSRTEKLCSDSSRKPDSGSLSSTWKHTRAECRRGVEELKSPPTCLRRRPGEKRRPPQYVEFRSLAAQTVP